MTPRLARSLAAAACVAACASSAGCRGCGSHPAGGDAGGPSPSASVPLLPDSHARAFAAPRFLDQASPRGFSLPQGCRLELPLRRAALPRGKLRFVPVPGEPSALALASAGPGDEPASRGLVDLDRHVSVDLPWSRFDSPPIVERSSQGWVAALSRPAANGLRRAVLWRQWTSPEALLEGDQLEVADLRCHADRCALLASLGRRAAAPGATLLVGRVTDPASAWKRVDIEADPAVGFRPYGLARFDVATGKGSVALAAPKSVELWRVDGGRARREGRIATPSGLYDVAPEAQPLVIAAGSGRDAPCAAGRSLLVVSRPGAPPERIATQTRPTSVVAAGVGSGALVVWIAPASCRDETRIVSALLLDAKGHAAGSPMAVAKASAFALATRKNRLSLWLSGEAGLTWLRASCSP